MRVLGSSAHLKIMSLFTKLQVKYIFNVLIVSREDIELLRIIKYKKFY